MRLHEVPGFYLGRFREELAIEFNLLRFRSLSQVKTIVDAPRSQERRVERLHVIRRHDKDHILWRIKSVQDIE
jgi:hypothetical protein